jgi:hypothetical protein
MTHVALPARPLAADRRAGRAASFGPALAVLAVVAVIAGGVAVANGGDTDDDIRPAGKAAPAVVD